MSAFHPSLLALAAVAIFASSAVAQTAAQLTGAWSGEIATPGGAATLTLKIDAEGKAVLDLPAMDMRDLPVEGPTVTDGVVRFSAPAIGGRFEGRLSEDRQTMTGTLTGGPMTLPVVLTRSPLPSA